MQLTSVPKMTMYSWRGSAFSKVSLSSVPLAIRGKLLVTSETFGLEEKSGFLGDDKELVVTRVDLCYRGVLISGVSKVALALIWEENSLLVNSNHFAASR